MSWISMLYQTYENNSSKAGVNDAGGKPLSLVAHMNVAAQIEITVDENGNFVSATEVSKDNNQTIIPVTEGSAGRSSKVAPHPLSDKLSYAAGDFGEYTVPEKKADNKNKKSTPEEKFKAYLNELKRWCDSDYSHPKARAVLKYAEKRKTISDLIECGLIKLDGKSGKFAKSKIQGKEYGECTVRYRVIPSENDGSPSATWEDKTLSSSFIKYYLSEQPGKRDICYVSGESDVICVNHPKGIIASSYNAKLISANDGSGFTYRGRFEKGEACTVSYNVTQKAHNALTWLAANQGVNVSGRTYICWNPVGKRVPGLFDDFDDESEGDTEPEFRQKLYKAFLGYENMLDDNDDIVIIALEATAKGRLSITYYSELKASEFLKNYKAWCESFKWYMPEFTPEGKFFQKIRTPNTRRLINYAFGYEQNKTAKSGKRKASENKIISADAGALKEYSQRIIHCMINNLPIPRDIVRALAEKASNPLAYSSYINRQRVLAYACAAIAKKYNDKENKGVKYGMTLDEKNTDRSYLFGRLLAVAEYTERLAIYISEKKESNEERETNAMRLRSAFSNHPMRTWRIIEEALSPYYAKLHPKTREYCRKLSCDILCSIEDICGTDQKLLNKKLEDVYLLGYSHQYNDITKKSNKENDREEI